MRTLIRDLAGAILACGGVFADTAFGQNPDPLALLRGAAAARESVKSGRLEIAYRTVAPANLAREGTVTFEFAGDKRTVAQTTDLFFINPGASGKFDTVGDRAKAEKMGLGKTKRTTMKYGWDGQRLANYWSGSSQAGYHNTEGGTTSFSFDPRTLGINIYHSFSVGIEIGFGLVNPRSVALVGEERVGDRPAWRVKVINVNGAESHYWVEGRSPFRVLRRQYVASDESAVLESRYDSTSDSPLPSEEVTRWYGKGGRLISEFTMKVTKMELDRPVSDKVGTMASLDVPVGTEVYDQIAGKQLGYWNGDGISPSQKEAVQQGIQALTGEEQGQKRALWPWVTVSAALVVVGVGLWRYGRGAWRTAS
jgi:hypothetical protein